MNAKKTMLALLIVSLFAGSAMAGSNPELSAPINLEVEFNPDNSDGVLLWFCVPDSEVGNITKFSIAFDLLVRYKEGGEDPVLHLVEVDMGANVGDDNVEFGDPNSCGNLNTEVHIELDEFDFLDALVMTADLDLECVDICDLRNIRIKGSECGNVSTVRVKSMNPPGKGNKSQNNPFSDPYMVEEDVEYKRNSTDPGIHGTETWLDECD